MRIPCTSHNIKLGVFAKGILVNDKIKNIYHTFYTLKKLYKEVIYMFFNPNILSKYHNHFKLIEYFVFTVF